MSTPTRLDGSVAFHLIVDPPAAGSWNMAVDEALLEAAIDGGPATLRLYQWAEPTLSLGYFQRYDDRHQHAASRDAAIVRRQTGGGAILHDRELTYSLTLPPGHPLGHDAGQLYSAVHRVLVQVFAPRLAEEPAAPSLSIVPVSAGPAAAGEPFLCFQRRAASDVVVAASPENPQASPSFPKGAAGWKIVGSAQRRRERAILQHGSVLLERSPAAPELPGWCDLTGRPLTFAELAQEFPRRFASELAVAFATRNLAKNVWDAARQIERAKYADSAWTNKR